MWSFPNRRWLSFSTRTLLIAVTIFGISLSWQRYWIRLRQEAIADADVWTLSADDYVGTPDLPNAPHLLWLHGEKGVDVIVVGGDDKAAKMTKLEQLFPEAQIVDEADTVPPMAGPDEKRITSADEQERIRRDFPDARF